MFHIIILFICKLFACIWRANMDATCVCKLPIKCIHPYLGKHVEKDRGIRCTKAWKMTDFESQTCACYEQLLHLFSPDPVTFLLDDRPTC